MCIRDRFLGLGLVGAVERHRESVHRRAPPAPLVRVPGRLPVRLGPAGLEAPGLALSCRGIGRGQGGLCSPTVPPVEHLGEPGGPRRAAAWSRRRAAGPPVASGPLPPGDPVRVPVLGREPGLLRDLRPERLGRVADDPGAPPTHNMPVR
eukprot:7165826-Lingulodinium_polyedra.AAC.1